MIRQMACSLKLPRKSHLSVIPVCQGRRKQFYIGQAESLDTFEYMENVATHIDTQATYIVQSTISIQGMLMLGSLEGYHQYNFEKQAL